MLSLHPSFLEFLQVGHLQSQRVIRPILSLGSEIDGFSLFCSDNATVSPLTGEGTQEKNLARRTVCRQRKSPHPNESGSGC